MSEKESSSEFERAILEASAVIVTLLFIILQLGQNWKDPEFVGTICFASLPFVISAMAATLAMFLRGSSGRLPYYIARALRDLGLITFVYGLGALWLVLYYMVGVLYPSYVSFLFLSLSAAAAGGVFITVVAIWTVLHKYGKRRKRRKYIA
jgi:hypothetical protein